MKRAAAAMIGPALAGLVAVAAGCQSGDVPAAPSEPLAPVATTVENRMVEDPVAVVFGSDPPSEADIATIERQLDEIDTLLDGLDAELRSE